MLKLSAVHKKIVYLEGQHIVSNKFVGMTKLLLLCIIES